MPTTKTYPTLSINAIAFQVSSGRGYEGHIKGCTESVIISVHEDHLMQNSISASPLPKDKHSYQ